MIIRAILPQWALIDAPNKKKVLEGQFSESRIAQINSLNYNIYYLPNYPGFYDGSKTVDGADIDVFNYVFVDLDMKDFQSEDPDRAHNYETKDDFILALLQDSPIPPTHINDSGNGIHAYWRVTDLDAMNFLRLQRRLARHLHTDPEVSKIYQLMRLPGTHNTKIKDGIKLCETIYASEDAAYTCEQLDLFLKPLSPEDDEYCKEHFAKTYQLEQDQVEVDEKLPVKFGALLKSNKEVGDIWLGNTDDRSKSDYRLGHIMCASGFSKDEALSVLVNTAKALARGSKHRVNYALNIVEKIWTFEEALDKKELNLSSTVKEILENPANKEIKGTRFGCYSYFDNTAHGFRLGQVIGFVGGSGVGKTATSLNLFMGFVEQNPDYDHFFVPLEQPANEIADRWKTMCGENTKLHEKVHVINNYDENGSYRHLSLSEIKDYILKFKEKTGKSIGCVVIDHIGALKKKNSAGEYQDLEQICQEMKAFAMQTNTMLIMQSQTSREKAGIGDLELNKDAAYGTVFFESYCDYLMTIWQPLKRCYDSLDCPTVTAFKFCKIRHKKQGIDVIKEDSRYLLFFDPKTERLREMTQAEESAFNFYNNKATNARKKDRKTDVLIYTTIKNNIDETQIKG